MKDAIIGVTMDRSGSMHSMWQEAVSGFNQFKNSQQNDEAKAWITLNYFDTEMGQKYNAWECHDIPDLTSKDDEIYPRGMTALRDCALKTIEDTKQWLDANTWFEGKVYQVVITDGMENASQSKPSRLQEAIKDKEEIGWEFIYLAANVDTATTAKSYGFNPANSMTYDVNSVGTAYTTTSNAILRSRSASGSEDNANLLDDDERDVRDKNDVQSDKKRKS